MASVSCRLAGVSSMMRMRGMTWQSARIALEFHALPLPGRGYTESRHGCAKNCSRFSPGGRISADGLVRWPRDTIADRAQVRSPPAGDPLHSPTLLILMTILMGLMSLVMAAVWRINRLVPGLAWWILAHGLGFLACFELLTRGRPAPRGRAPSTSLDRRLDDRRRDLGGGVLHHRAARFLRPFPRPQPVPGRAVRLDRPGRGQGWAQAVPCSLHAGGGQLAAWFVHAGAPLAVFI